MGKSSNKDKYIVQESLQVWNKKYREYNDDNADIAGLKLSRSGSYQITKNKNR